MLANLRPMQNVGHSLTSPRNQKRRIRSVRHFETGCTTDDALRHGTKLRHSRVRLQPLENHTYQRCRFRSQQLGYCTVRQVCSLSRSSSIATRLTAGSNSPLCGSGPTFRGKLSTHLTRSARCSERSSFARIGVAFGSSIPGSRQDESRMPPTAGGFAVARAPSENLPPRERGAHGHPVAGRLRLPDG